jgi:hypothetical protein
MAGPLGRILASEWTVLRPDITFLDFGSFFDALLSERTYPLDIVRDCMFQGDSGRLNLDSIDIPEDRNYRRRTMHAIGRSG